MEPRREDVLRALERVIDPELGRPVTELDMVRDVRVQGGDVAVTIALTVAGCPLRSSFESQVRETVGALPGVTSVSLGFDVMSPEENEPVMWRGPMLHRALEQFLSDVHWGDLDTLVVDMPPGTGDVAISLGQLLPRAEAVVVTTPHRAAQQVAVRAAQMARKTNMRLLGVVENMSYLVGSGEEIFGSGGGPALWEEVDAPLPGRIPFDPRLGAYADE